MRKTFTTPTPTNADATPAASGGDLPAGQVFPSADDDIVLPNARDVNRAERAQREREKETKRRSKTGAGKYRALMAHVKAKHRGDPRKQIAAFLSEAVLIAAIGERREVSQRTRTAYSEVLQQTVTDLAERRVYLESIGDLTQRHVINLLKYWLEKKNEPATIRSRLSVLRRFTTLIGKESAVLTGRPWHHVLRQHGIDPAALQCRGIAELAKGWVDQGTDARGLIEAVRADCAVSGCILDCMWAYGLRVNEAVQLQPRISANGDKGLTIYRGTKGGKVREVPFSTTPERRAWQLSVLQTACSLADKHPKRVLAIKGLRLDQMKNRFREVLKEHGITKKALGITPHGLRHQFGTEEFHEITGLPAPVLEQVPTEVYTKQADKVADGYLKLSQRMGHERPSISGAYISTVPRMKRVEKARLSGWLDQLAGASEEFVQAGALDAWIVGAGAFGLPIAEGAALQLAVRFTEPDGNTTMARELAAHLSASLGIRVSIHAWLEADRPQEGAEVLIEIPASPVPGLQQHAPAAEQGGASA